MDFAVGYLLLFVYSPVEHDRVVVTNFTTSKVNCRK